MRWHPSDPRLHLIELADLRADPPPDLVRRNQAFLGTVAAWAREYLCKPHQQLGRKGPVCPFVQTSMDHALFYLSVYRGKLASGEVSAIVSQYADWFLDLEPRRGDLVQYKTILILFPDIPAERVQQVIDHTQAELKAGYVARGLMVGEFYPGPQEKRGLWDADFRPLISPIPLLAVRHMVATDFPFLRHDPSFVRSYLHAFGGGIPPHLHEQVREATTRFGLTLDGRDVAAS